jgi:hypothetical protein
MRTATSLTTVSAIALAAGGYYYYLTQTGDVTSPPSMETDGETIDRGVLVERKTVDYEAIIKKALIQEASFLTLTLARDVVRDQHLETSIRYTPFPASTARVRVKYHVEYPIGFVLRPGRFKVSGDATGLLITLHRPQLIAHPSVRLLSHRILDAGILVDEDAALVELQQRIQPEAERRAAGILRRPDVIPRSEKALRAFLEAILARQAGGPAPPIRFRYR